MSENQDLAPGAVVDQHAAHQDDEHLTLVALTPAEMPDQQRALAAWCDTKIDAIQRELGQWRALEDEAVLGGFKHASYSAAVRRTEKRITYYQKIKAAIEAGYLIVPNLPTTVFAVRVKRSAPRPVESQYQRRFQATAEQLPAGTGRYVDDDLQVRSRRSRDMRDGKPVETTMYFATEYNEDIDFPLRGVHPRVLKATAQAMALRLFDEVGVADNRTGRDPIVLGRLLDPRGGGRMATFFVAWWLNTADL